MHLCLKVNKGQWKGIMQIAPEGKIYGCQKIMEWQKFFNPDGGQSIGVGIHLSRQGGGTRRPPGWEPVLYQTSGERSKGLNMWIVINHSSSNLCVSLTMVITFRNKGVYILKNKGYWSSFVVYNIFLPHKQTGGNDNISARSWPNQLSKSNRATPAE